MRKLGCHVVPSISLPFHLSLKIPILGECYQSVNKPMHPHILGKFLYGPSIPAFLNILLRVSVPFIFRKIVWETL